MMHNLELYLLGPPRALLGGKRVQTKTRKSLALLIYLAVTAIPQTRDFLATFLWPELDQQRARRSLRHALWLLKKAGLSEWMVADHDAIGLVARYSLDVHSFQEHIDIGELAEAVALYRDDFLAGFTLRDSAAFDEWQFEQQSALQRSLAGALEALVRRCEEDGDFGTGLDYAHRWLAMDRLHEPAHRAVMRLYARSNQVVAALRQYEACERVLEEELDIRPEVETRQLLDRIRSRQLSRDTIARAADDQSSATRPVVPVKHNLPEQASILVDRETELEELDALLDKQRLVTIVGPGGIGKTRLALAAAERQIATSQFADGIYFVSLVGVGSVEHIPYVIAEGLKISFEGEHVKSDVENRLLDYLRDKQLLLILDNCEHLLKGMKYLSGVLGTAPQIKFLATSRARLHLKQEQVYPLQGLSYPEKDTLRADFPALTLFLQCAQRTRPDFSLSESDRPILMHICRLVEGLPLAIELLASWVSVLPLSEIAASVQSSLDLLESNLQDVSPRQRSIRAVFDSTWRRLMEQERSVLMRLSVFQGGFTREAAQEVAGANLKLLARLAETSLLRFHPEQDRYTIHELLRQYAAEKLAENDDSELLVYDQLSTYFCHWLAGRADALEGPEQVETAAGIEAEIDNLHLAWAWAIQRYHFDDIERAANGLGRFFEWRGLVQFGEEAFRQAAQQFSEREDEPVVLLGKLLAWQGFFTFLKGNPVAARRLLEQSTTYFTKDGSDPDRAFAYTQLGLVTTALGEDEAEKWYERALACYRGSDSHWETAEALAYLGRRKHMLAQFEQAEQSFRESLALKRLIGDRRGVARVLGLSSQTAVELGQFDRAERLARESNAIYEELELHYGFVEGLRQLAVILLWSGENARAQELLQQSLTYCEDIGNRALVAEVHSLQSLALANLGQPEDAQDHAEVGLKLAREVAGSNQIAWALWASAWNLASTKAYARAEALLQESTMLYKRIASETSEPRQMGWALSLMSYVQFRQGNVTESRQTLTDVLAKSVQLRDVLPLLTAVPVAALVFEDIGNKPRAAELFGLAWRYPLITNSRAWLAQVGQELGMMVAAIPIQEAEAATARGKGLDLWQTATMLLEELQA